MKITRENLAALVLEYNDLVMEISRQSETDHKRKMDVYNFISKAFSTLSQTENDARPLHVDTQDGYCLWKEESDTVIALVKACLDYLAFHTSEERSATYKMFSSHGKEGRERAVACLDEIATFLNSVTFVTANQVNELREKLIADSKPVFKGDHSLYSFLEQTPAVAVSRKAGCSVM